MTVFTPGAVCPDCSGPMYQYCPLCGVDLLGTGHGVLEGPTGRLTICTACVKRGGPPPIRHETHRLSHADMLRGFR